MNIKQYIQDLQPFYINGIKFSLFGVNYDEELDINEKTLFDSDPVKDDWFSFLDRFQKAKEEIFEDTKNKTLKEVKDYYKRMTEEGNHYYWGGMIWVSTSSMEKDGDTIYFGVRMD